jgi:hypothetical protein
VKQKCRSLRPPASRVAVELHADAVHDDGVRAVGERDRRGAAPRR